MKQALRITITTLVCLSLATAVLGRTMFDSGKSKDPRSGMTANEPPCHGLVGHRIGRMELGVNNNGTLGTNYTVGFNEDWFTGEEVKACEYPRGSNTQYLFGAAFGESWDDTY